MAAGMRMVMIMPMGTAIMIIDPAKLMRLQSWLSPAFPIGAYSYSHALEWAVEAGSVTDRTSLIEWLEADLRCGSGRNDAILFAQAWTFAPCKREWRMAPGEGEPIGEASVFSPPSPAMGESENAFLALAELAAAMRGTAEFALESTAQGAAFLATVCKAWPHPQLDHLSGLLKMANISPVLPVAAGAVCRVHDIPLQTALPLYLQTAIANYVNAGVRLIPLGQSDGQLAIAVLEEAVVETAAEALTASIDDLGSSAFMIDIASMRHETQYTRLFRS